MNKNRIYHIIEWTVALAACGWLAWRLATYEDYAALWATLQGMGAAQWSALALCVVLMPVNMAIEAWRWHTLMNGENDANDANGEMMNFQEAQRQVYYSKLAGLVTPWRLGEYPARWLLLVESLELKVKRSSEVERGKLMARVLSLGAVGSATMTAAIIATGIVAMIMDNGQWTMDNYCFLVGAVLILLVIALWFAPRLLKRWADVSRRLILVSLGQSFVRLLCWCVQLALVLWALGAVTGYGLWDTGTLCAIYYLLVTITPNVPIAEVGVRGAWAVVLFGSVNAAFAGVLLWAINTLLPCLFALPLAKKY